MKNALAFLLTASTIYAAESNCCCTEPACCPQLCELQNNCGFFIEFLYWYAKENKLPLAMKAEKQFWGQNDSGDTASGFSPQSDIYMKESWDPGFRVGIGWKVPCTDFSTSVRYTYYHNTRSQTEKVPFSSEYRIDLIPNGTQVLITPWDYYAFPISSREVFTYDRIKGKWKLMLNQVDWQIDCNCWLGSCFNLRPFAGLRADWISIDFTVDALDEGVFINVFPYTINEEVKFSNDHWGVGLLAGIEPRWYFSPCFGVFGLLDVSLVWGEFEGKRKENYTLSSSGSDTTFPTLNTRNKFHGMQGILDLGLGIFYTTNICDYYNLTFDLGWENHIWYNHVNRVQFDPVDFFPTAASVERYFQKTDEFASDLVLAGLTFKVCFDF